MVWFLGCVLVFVVGCILILVYLFSCCVSCLGSFGFPSLGVYEFGFGEFGAWFYFLLVGYYVLSFAVWVIVVWGGVLV